jgi:Fe-S cluster assembly protein SufD
VSGEPAWLQERRTRAAERALSLGLPSQKQEVWKYTSAARFLLDDDISAIGPVDSSTLSFLDNTPESSSDLSIELLDGHALTDSVELPSGAFFGTFAAALSSPALAAVLEQHLGSLDAKDQSLHAWSLAHFQTGLLLHVPAGIQLPSPLTLLHRRASSASPAWTRVLVVLEAGARAEFIELHESSEGTSHRSLAVTEIVLSRDSALVHGRLGLQAPEDISWTSTLVHQETNSRYVGHAAQLGAAYARNEYGVVLAAPEAECSLKGIFRPDASRHHDIQTMIDHAAPHCRSEQVVKGVLDGSSTGVFHGRVYVRPGAKGTRAFQSNRNLLLSRKAQVYSRPQLEIENDDVKASHGSATGNLDEKALFFLRARGFSLASARAILIRAFLQEVAESLPWEGLRSRVHQLLGGEA